eukprot:14450040-Ditylum_brightwellii.AAC.1
MMRGVPVQCNAMQCNAIHLYGFSQLALSGVGAEDRAGCRKRSQLALAGIRAEDRAGCKVDTTADAW